MSKHDSVASYLAERGCPAAVVEGGFAGLIEQWEALVTSVEEGYGLGRLARARPEIKVLYMSGYTDEAVVRHGVLAGDTPFIQKPFSPDGLAGKLREVLETS